MRALLIGFVAGVGLSILRAPLGVELVQFAGTGAETAAGFRAAGLILLAICAWFAAPRLEGAGFGAKLLGGVALGLAANGLALGWTPPTHRGVIGASLALAFVALVAGRAGVAKLADDEREAAPRRPGSMFAYAFVGAGLAVALECVARPLRWFGGGLAADDALFACCLLVPAAVVGFAFRRALEPSRSSKLARAFGAQGVAIGAIAGVSLLALFLDPRRLAPHVVRVGLDTSDHGTLAFDAWIAAPVLAIAALGLGVLAAGLRRRAQLAALALGAAAATLALPRLFAIDSHFASDDAFALARAAAALTCVGSALALYAEAGDEERVSWRLALCLPALALALYLPLPRLELRSSWRMQEPQVLFARDTAEGWLSVEVRSGRGVVCLDGRPITPELADREAERRLVHAAWRGKAEGSGDRVLLVGQLGPARAAALAEVGVRVVDRCSAWSESTRDLEEHVFAWEGASPPGGERLGIREARARLAAGEYDFVYAPPVYVEAPGTRQLGGAPGVTAALAFSGATATWARGLGPTLVPVQTGLEQLDVLVFGGPHAELGLDGVPAGPSRHAEAPWRALARREDERARFHRGELARRLADAAQDAPDETRLATAALATQIESQRRSSPFESPAQRVEIPTAALEAWRDAGLTNELSHMTRLALEDLAALLYQKRMLDEARAYLTPVADAQWPWPQLERVLALCQVEVMDPEAALERFEALAEDGGLARGDWWLLAYLQASVGRVADAEASAERARESGATAPRWEQAYEQARAAQSGAGPPLPLPPPPPRNGDSDGHDGHGPH